jgi:drug/metabolite transporter (DMT)-like permease
LSNREQGLRGKRSPFVLLASLVLALGLVWGSSWMATTTLAEYLPPLRVSALRFLLGALLCLPFLFGRRQKLPRGRALAAALILSLTLVALPVALLLWVQPQLPSATVVVLFAAMPLLLSFGAPWAAMRASIIALGMLAFSLGFSFYLGQALPAAVVLVAVVSIAESSLALRSELRNESPVAVTALLLGPAGVMLGIASIVLERGAAMQWNQWNKEMILSLIFLGAVAGTGGYVTYVWLLQRMEAYQVATLEWIEPLVAVLGSAWSVHIAPSFRVIAGVVVTVFCVLMVLRARPEDDNPVSLLGDGPLKVG